jgi:hypothetical protein
MEELDLLKKDWKRKENSFSQLSEKEIYTMLHRKSSSIVKWILIIGILEVLVWTGIGVIFSADDYLEKLNHPHVITYLKAFNYVNYAVVLTFIYLFYKNYVTITATASTKKLMKDILKTRKTVQYYVWYNLTIIALSLAIGFMMAISYSPEVSELKDRINHDGTAMAKVIGLMALAIIVCVFVFWLIYRMIYGILLKKLHANYKELKKMDL